MFGLDAFQTYLVIVNIVAFLTFTIDFLVYIRTGEETFNHVGLCIFALIGGPAGMLLAFLIWDRQIRKDNVAWRFIALCMLVVWALIIANVYGWHRFDGANLLDSLTADHTPLLIYLAAINVVTLVVFLVDKIKAISGAWRIREAVLLGLSFVGGAAGGMLGMYLARHKINTYYFKFGLPIMLVIQVVVIVFLLQAGIV